MNRLINSEILNEYFYNKYEIFCVYLFGSVIDGREMGHSDVDIAILYSSAVSPSEYSDSQITLSVELSQLVNRNVDIVILNRTVPYLKFNIIQKGIRIYENPERKDRSFEAHSIIEYFDFLPIKNRLESALIKRIKEA